MLKQRVIAYIDGFNLYYGLRSKGWRRYYWLDMYRLVENLLRPQQQVMQVRYFTSRVISPSNDPGKAHRQNTYLEALQTLPNFTITYGQFLPKERTCPSCGATTPGYEEKMTDVNIAVSMLADAYDDLFDTALLISGDSDLYGPISEVRHRHPRKRVIVAFPPGRVSKKLRKEYPSFTIGRKVISDSQLPPTVTSTDGYPLTRPASWK